MRTMNIVWLANTVTHYHRARADAFARELRGSFKVIALTSKDPLLVLEAAPCEFAQIVTLFPGMAIQDIGQAERGKALVGYLDETQPDVCCLNGWALAGSATMLGWALRNQVPCVLMSESNEHDSKRTWWREAAKRRFVTQCSAALVGGSWHRDYLVKLGMPPDYVFDGYDIVDNEHFREGAEEARRDLSHAPKALGRGRDYFLACARFEEKKNLCRLIEAYALYIQQCSSLPWELVIVGDGPARGQLRSLAESLGIRDNIKFMGLVGYQELPAIYGLAGAFVHASTTEQWGLVVNEAMAAGLPVLVSDRCGCVSELVRDGVNGFTFNPWKIDEIAQRMLLIHRDVGLLKRMGQESTESIRAWGPKRFARNLGRAVESAISRGPRPRGFVSEMTIRCMAAL